MGPGWREKCPEKRTVPVGSGDVCSTVHGSYQLSTDGDRAAHMHVDQAAPPDLGTWSWLVPISPIKPKGNKLFKNPHSQILHAIFGQMNKQKLLLFTFMQNNREGRQGVCLAPFHCQGGVATRNKGGHSPLHGLGPLRIHATPAQGQFPIY